MALLAFINVRESTQDAACLWEAGYIYAYIYIFEEFPQGLKAHKLRLAEQADTTWTLERLTMAEQEQLPRYADTYAGVPQNLLDAVSR